MDENIIFHNPKEQSEEKEETPVPSASESIASQNYAEKNPLSSVSISSPPEGDSPSGSSFFSLSMMVKALIGIIVLLGIGFLIFRFINSNLNDGKNKKVDLTYWILFEDPKAVELIISDFQRENPNIKISYIKQDPKQYRERLLTRVKNGTGPDIFRFHNTWLPQIKDSLSPISDDAISKKDFQQFFYPVAQSDLILNGAIYGIPLGIDTLTLFINKDIFNSAGVQAPKTWDEFEATARSLTVKDENGKIKTAGAAFGTFDNITHAPDIISLLFVQNGADLRSLASTSNAEDALNFYIRFAKGEGNVWDSTLEPSVVAFSKGDLAMYFGYSWDIFSIKAMNPNLSFSLSPVPHLTDREMTIASYWAEGVSIKSKHQKEAMSFMKFLAKKETEQKLFSEASKNRLFGEPYARVDLAESLKGNELVYPFVEQAKTASSSFFAGDTYDNGLNTKMNNYLGDAVRSMLNNTSPQTAVQVLSNGVAQVLQQYGQK